MAPKSYEQYCGVARALDVVGERWNLLIVRQLLAGPARYGELATALPGVATNLLADRLRHLVAAGVVERRLDPQRNGATYALTPWGAELRETIESLIRWSTPLMTSGPGGDAFRPEWLAIALRALLADRRPRRKVVVGFETAGTTVVVRLDRHGADVALAERPLPPTVLEAEPGIVFGLAAGVLTVEQAVEMGALRGDPADLDAAFSREARSAAGPATGTRGAPAPQPA